MQAQSQLSEQPPGHVSGQLTAPSQNMNSLTSNGGARGSWHTESDVGTRRMVAEKILLLFEKRKPRLTLEWQQRLPELVKRLEESLYRDARSKEEYADISTLEQRLQATVKNGPARNNLTAGIRGMNASSSTMVPTPGIVPSSVNGCTMIPTPGSINTNSNNNLGNVTPPGSTSHTNVNNMVPTPGIHTNLLMHSESSTVNVGNPMSGGVQSQKQPYNTGSSGLMNRNVNGELAGSMANNMQRKFTYVNGSMANGPLNFSNPPMYTAPRFGNMPPQGLQHQQRMPIQSTRPSHLTANSANLAQPGSFYSSVSNGVPSNNPNMHAQGGFQASKMIPVPGLPSQQLDMQPQKPQQPQSQEQKLLHMKSQKKMASTGRKQRKVELIKTETSQPLDDERQPILGSRMSLTHSLPSQEESKPIKQLNQQSPSMSSDHHDRIALGQSQLFDKGVEELVEKKPNIEQQKQHLSSHSLVEDREWKEKQQVATSQLKSEVAKEMGNCVSPLHAADNTVGNFTGKALPSGIADPQMTRPFLKQQRWLLFLRHASKCTAPEGQCQVTPHCYTARQLWTHIGKCNDRNCQYARCQISQTLVRHHQSCRDAQCPVCAPVRHKIAMQNMQATQSSSSITNATTSNASRSNDQIVTPPAAMDVDASFNRSMGMSTPSNLDVKAPPAKRMKIEPTELAVDAPAIIGALNVEPCQETLSPVGVAKIGAQEVNGSTAPCVKPEVSASLNDKAPAQCSHFKSEQGVLDQGVEDISVKQDLSSVGLSKAPAYIKQELQQEKVASPVGELGNNSKGGKPKVKGVTLTELFTPDQIREHIIGLRQWVGQSKTKAEKNQAMEHRMSESSCQLCAVETLTFEPPPIYCTPCGARIKRNAFYWTMQVGETRHYICIPCYNDPRAETVDIDGINYPKLKLEKRKNDEETEEPWVQCDKCEKWQHQVCALFNMRRNDGGQAEYTCPQCLMEEVERGERKPLPQSAVLGAKDLPRTLLSDHIEQRLVKRLKQERHERARAQGKSFEEVPGADSLVVRIVSSVDKKLEVKQRFLEMFQEEDYASEFPYKSKVLLLFQKIEGVEVCLFGMYVQEFGIEAAQPNQRRVYLSYLDSVKYFRPDVRTVHGEALRTFVYHEILIGYLDYCKQRGFTSCYIWACPPLKGEDYILYCHPEIQKTPKSDKLREWYLSMLRKACNENIVVELTNMYDHFFVSIGETKAKVTAARLPYFDGDYWPGAAEDMIIQLQEEEVSQRQQKKGKTKNAMTKRSAKFATQTELASNASKDLQLMHKLGETIRPIKEDFIMVHLQFSCSHCSNFILSGRRWICKQCKGFHICDRCYNAEQKCDERERHPSNSKEFHPLFPVELGEPLDDTRDRDEIVESEFFDTRQAFLSLCQGNHYQYDTLRRAKHSSMMVLYHLHNPTAPAFVITCNTCHCDIETGQGWRCETCPDFDICNSCYSKDDSVKHPHKLSPHQSAAERDTQSKEARQQRVLQLRKMLDLLVHASQCGSAQCLYPNCRRVKGLFRHGMCCKVRASGGCHLCKKMWYLLQLHARACKESECKVPRCKDLKEHLRRLQQQMESRRRAAVKEMMRQRTAEAAADTS